MNPAEREPIWDAIAGQTEEVFAFEEFRMFPARRLLLEGNMRVEIGGRAFDILATLVRAAGSVVSKDDLLARAWPGVFVQEGSLRVQIAGIRKLLRDGVGERRFIINNPGRGYSFTAPIKLQMSGENPDSDVQARKARNDLPAVLTRVFGRQSSIDGLTAALPQHRFVTIVGPGGIGKTTVALLAAATARANCQDGACFIDLAPVTDPALVSSVLSSAFGLPVTSRDPVPDLVGYLRDRQVLVVIDNCEHVIEAAATLVEAILSRASRVQILATSREPLRAKGEHVHALGPLAMPPTDVAITAKAALGFSAIQLFVDRSTAARADFELSDEDVPKVTEICRRLDGIALAIELATAQMGTLGLNGVAAGLHDRFQLLSRGLRTASPRHRTLNAVYDWSFELLPTTAQCIYRRLSVFTGSFSLEAAQAVASDGAVSDVEVAESISTLVDASLLTADLAGGSATYRLLESARAYGRDRLVEANELAVVSRRHAEFFLKYFESATVRSAGWSSMQWVEAYEAQLDNLRAALDWSSSTPEWRLLEALSAAAVPVLTHLSLNEECRARVQSALATRPDGLPHDAQSEMQLYAGLGMSLLYTRGRAIESNAAWHNCLVVAKRHGDTDYQLRAIAGLWSASFNEGNMSAVRHLQSQFDEIAGASPSFEDALHSRRMRGMELFYKGNFRESGEHLQAVYDGYSKQRRGMDVLRFRVDQTVLASVNFAKVLWLLGYPDQATQMAVSSLTEAKSLGHEISITYTLAFAACRISIINGDHESAEDYIDQLFYRSTIDRGGPWRYFGQCWKGTLLSRQGYAVEASEMLRDALIGVPDGSFGMHHTRFLGELAFAVAQTGDVAGGLSKIRRAIDICEHLGEEWFLAELIRIEGEILRLSGTRDIALAGQTFRRAIKLANRQGGMSYELRAANSLVRLGISQGSIGDIEILESIYGRFSEGFGTADLIESKRLISAIRS